MIPFNPALLLASFFTLALYLSLIHISTFIHNSAENFDKIYVSGGRIGTTICLDPKELAEVTRAQFADIIVHES